MRQLTPPLHGSVHRPLPHDSAEKHVTGEALYIDDLPEPATLLHAYIRMSERPHARIESLDLGAARAAPGVVAAVAAADVPGELDIGPVHGGEPLLADGIVQYVGQPLFAVAAESLSQARRAAMLVPVAYQNLPAVLDVAEALETGDFLLPPCTMGRGDPAAAIAAAPHRLAGEIRLGGQDHFYLEGQIAMAQPGEAGEMHVWSSTQHPSEVQAMVARVLGVPAGAVTVELRRLGGGFGGKETQAAGIACIAALLARRSGRPVKLRLDRDDDMVMTGKRHDMLIRYRTGFDGDGRILGLELDLAARGGWSADLSGAVVDRAMFHAGNAYYLEHVRIIGHACRTNTVSNTAFRGFGGPQGMCAIEYVLDEIARRLGLDALAVRKANLYRPGRDITYYGQRLEETPVPALIERLEASAAYAARRQAVAVFNAADPWRRRGLALTPVMFGISFTTTHLNQAGALLHIYTDGSIHLNHGGTEMGQGVMTKVAQVVAEELGVAMTQVSITATSTAKVPNTSATAASTGSDLNGKAAQAAARILRQRLTAFAAGRFEVAPDSIRFHDGAVEIAGETLAFAELARQAWLARVPLSATGFYATPDIHFDRATGQGRPFLYFACGAAVAEVEVDILTGAYRVLRADLLHDCGRSLNPAIDRGQVEGGFVQGMGWLTSEELWWDGEGRLRTHAPSTYKIPTARDLPADFRVELLQGESNRADTVFGSKAVGEPPLMLAISVWLALKDAVAAAAGAGARPRLDAPATPEHVLLAIEDARAAAVAAAATERPRTGTGGL